jgi:hypothetical protein
MLPTGFRANLQVRRRLIHLWEQLVAGGAMTFTVVEDLEQRYPNSIEGFGLSIFVTDRFFDEFCKSPRPYMSSLLYERMLAGEADRLAREDIAETNSTTGLNIVVLHFGMRNEDLAELRTMQMLAMGSAGFYFFHGGYRIKSILNEVYGEQEARFMKCGGFRLLRDFQRESPVDFEGLAPRHYPYLFMLQQDWIEPGAVNPLSQLFAPPAPRLCFATSERRVLEGALLNESDAAIANRLGVSMDGVKKIWRSIYSRAGCRIPDLISHSDLTASVRGKEKRRHLLEYVRMHLEELRPPHLLPERSGTTPVSRRQAGRNRHQR